jgi:hypothetical protein
MQGPPTVSQTTQSVGIVRRLANDDDGNGAGLAETKVSVDAARMVMKKAFILRCGEVGCDGRVSYFERV